MPIEVHAPDGSVVHFPDGTSDATITSVMRREYGGPSGGGAGPAKKRPNPVIDALESFAGGVPEGLASLGDQVLNASPFGTVVGGLKTAAGVSDALRRKLPELAEPVGEFSAMTARNAHAPQTTAGRYARAAGQMAPAALIPGSALTRLKNVLLPALGSETAGEAAQAAGADPRLEQAARMAGGLGGAGVASVRIAPRVGSAADMLPDLDEVPHPAARSAPVAAALDEAPVLPPRRSNRVAEAVARAVERDDMDPASLAAQVRESGALPFHAGGENLTSLAEVAAQSPGKARQSIVGAVRDHQARVPDDVKADIGTSLGGRGDYFATLDAAQNARAAAAKPLMEAAFEQPIDLAAYNDKIAPLMGRLPRGSLEHAYDIARREGIDPKEIGLEVSAQSGDLPVMVKVTRPTLKTLHYIKKGIDQTLEQYRNPVTRELDLTGSPGAQVDSQVRKALGRAMRDVNPDYDKAMATWGDDSDQINALELGRNIFSPKFDMNSERLGGQVKDMSDAGRDNFRKGVGEALLSQVRSAKGGVGAMRQLLRSDELSDRVKLAFPDQESFEGFMLSASRRVREQERNNRIVGGSPTYGRTAARNDLEAQSADPVDMLAGAVDGFIHPGQLTAKALRATLKRLPRQDRSVIGDPAMNQALGEALSNPKAFADLLDRVAARRAQPKTPLTMAPREALPAASVVAATAAVPASPEARQRPR